MSEGLLILREGLGEGRSAELLLERIVVTAQTEFQTVMIGDSRYFGRALIIDGSTQSCERDEGAYHSALVHPPMLAHPEPRRVLIAGGGEGASARDVLLHPGVERVVMVDIDGELVELCKQHLPSWHRGVFDDPRLEVRAEDIRSYVESVAPASFDVLVHDLCDPRVEGPARRAFSREFFAAAKRALTRDGVMSMQVAQFSQGFEALYRAMICTLGELFAHVQPYRRYVDSFGAEWGFLLASDAQLSRRGELAGRLAALGELPDYDAAVHRAQFALTPRERARLREPAPSLSDVV